MAPFTITEAEYLDQRELQIRAEIERLRCDLLMIDVQRRIKKQNRSPDVTKRIIAEFSRRETPGEVGKLVEDWPESAHFLSQLSIIIRESHPQSSTRLKSISDALTRLSSAPVDAGVASAVEKLKRLSYGPEDPRRIVANMLESLSRQNAELRQAWAEVRAEIDALDTYCATDEDAPGYFQAIGEALAILAQHTPKEG